MKTKISFSWEEVSSILVEHAVKNGAIDAADYELDGSAITGYGDSWALEIGLRRSERNDPSLPRDEP